MPYSLWNDDGKWQWQLMISHIICQQIRNATLTWKSHWWSRFSWLADIDTVRSLARDHLACTRQQGRRPPVHPQIAAVDQPVLSRASPVMRPIYGTRGHLAKLLTQRTEIRDAINIMHPSQLRTRMREVGQHRRNSDSISCLTLSVISGLDPALSHESTATPLWSWPLRRVCFSRHLSVCQQPHIKLMIISSWKYYHKYLWNRKLSLDIWSHLYRDRDVGIIWRNFYHCG